MITILKRDSVLDINESHLCLADPEEIRLVIQECKTQRSLNGKGISKNGNLAAAGDIPASVYWDPRLRHIFHNPDRSERERLTRKFLERNSKFKNHTRRLI